MEMEFFVPPDEAPQWFEHWMRERYRVVLELGIREDHLSCARTTPTSCRTTRRGTSDVEYLFPIGW